MVALCLVFNKVVLCLWLLCGCLMLSVGKWLFTASCRKAVVLCLVLTDDCLLLSVSIGYLILVLARIVLSLMLLNHCFMLSVVKWLLCA